MIAVETKPVACSAVQWHQEGDGEGVVVRDPIKYGEGPRWGVHSALGGFQRVSAGDWIVIDPRSPMNPRVLANAEFHQAFKIVGKPG